MRYQPVSHAIHVPSPAWTHPDKSRTTYPNTCENKQLRNISWWELSSLGSQRKYKTCCIPKHGCLHDQPRVTCCSGGKQNLLVPQIGAVGWDVMGWNGLEWMGWGSAVRGLHI